MSMKEVEQLLKTPPTSLSSPVPPLHIASLFVRCELPFEASPLSLHSFIYAVLCVPSQSPLTPRPCVVVGFTTSSSGARSNRSRPVGSLERLLNAGR